MKPKSIVSLGTGCVLVVSCITCIVSQAKADDEVRFICVSGFDKYTNQHRPTTYAWTSRGKIAFVRWKYAWFNNSDYSPEQRCQEVSSRFQAAYDNQSLSYIANGSQNGQAVICTAREKGGACTTLLTLRPKDDPLEVLNELKGMLRGEPTEPIQHGSTTQVYYKIGIKEFLETAPVE